MSKKPDTTENDATLPFSALRLLAPPIRLLSAGMWKVVKEKNVMQYGTLEEMVTLACEAVPGLLTYRHQGKLALGLRARLILELCRGVDHPDPKVIIPHLERIRVPAASTLSSVYQKKRDVKIEKTVGTFQEFVQTLLRNTAEREHFFKDIFPVDYGPHFDQALEKLLWEFLIRLDQLLPVPNLAQTVSWLSSAPPVLEECAHAATQPQLLSLLLQHQSCLGHLETAASLPQNMGDCILTSLSLPPSGRVSSNQKTQHTSLSTSLGDTVSPIPVSETHHKTSFITPVIGLICNEDVPVMMASNKTKSRDDELASSRHVTKKECKQKGSLEFTLVRQKEKSGDRRVNGDDEEAEQGAPKGTNSAKRKQPHVSESDSEDELGRATGSPRKCVKKSARNGVPRQNAKENEEHCVESGREQESSRVRLRSCMLQRGLETLKLPEDPSLCRIVTSCLLSSPKVLLKRSSVKINSQNGGAKTTVFGQPQGVRMKSSIVVLTQAKLPNQASNTRMPAELELTDFGDKENHPVSPVISSPPSAHHRNLDAEDDFIVDSEDEATKNFKDRLFVKRYCKTKHDTYVPTLREFWKPGLTRRNRILSGFSPTPRCSQR